MGTLFSQPNREYQTVTHSYLDDFLADAVMLAKKHGITVEDVIAAQEALEMKRRNDLFVFDEQIAGLGEILQELVSAVEKLGSGAVLAPLSAS